MTPLARRAFARALILLAALAGPPALAQYGVPAPVTPAVNTACPTFVGFPLALNLGSPALFALDGVTSRCGFSQVQQALNTRGQPNGFASLDAGGLVPIQQVPFVGSLDATGAGKRAVEQGQADDLSAGLAPLSTTLLAPNVPYALLGAVRVASFVNQFEAVGYATAGDLGAGMPLVRCQTGGTQSADGARWCVNAAPLPDIPVGYCGAVADDATDNTAAFQACAAIANASGKKLRIRTAGGTMRVGRPGPAPTATGCWVRADVGVIGDGPFRSYVRNLASDDNLFCSGDYAAAQFVGVAYLPQLDASGAAKPPTGGATIVVDAVAPSPINQNFFSVVENNNFEGQHLGVYFKRANSPRVENNQFGDYTYAGVVLDNIDNSDNGDQVIVKNTFDAGNNSTSVAVIQFAAGGLRMSNNKVGRGVSAYRLLPRQGVNTSILKIDQNSFENQVGAAVFIALPSGTTSASFLGVEVTNNEITSGSGGGAAIDIDGSGWLALMKVRGNRIVFPNGVANPIGTIIRGGVGLDYGNNIVHGFNVPATAVNIFAGVTGTVTSDTLLGAPMALTNSSLHVSLAAELTRAIPDMPYYAKNPAEAAPGAGYLTLPAFGIAMSPGAKALVEIDLDGYSPGVGGSIFNQRYGLVVGNDNASIAVTPLWPVPSAPAIPPGAGAGVQGWSAEVSPGGLSATVNLHNNAPVAGSNVRARMRVIGGTGSFRTIQ